MMSAETALKQAGWTAEIYFDAAYDYFKERGIQKPDPVLIAAFVNACSKDFALSVRSKLVETHVDPLA